MLCDSFGKIHFAALYSRNNRFDFQILNVHIFPTFADLTTWYSNKWAGTQEAPSFTFCSYTLWKLQKLEVNWQEQW